MRMVSGWRSPPFRLRCRSATRSRRLMAAARTGRACGWLSSMVALPPIAAANGPTSMACATTWSAANPDRKALLCCRAVGWSNAALAGLRIGAACCATAPDGWMSQPGVSPSSPFCLVFRHCSIQCQSVPLDYENPTQTGSEAVPASGVAPDFTHLGLKLLDLLPHDRHLSLQRAHTGAGVFVGPLHALHRAHVHRNVVTDPGDGVCQLFYALHDVAAGPAQLRQEVGPQALLLRLQLAELSLQLGLPGPQPVQRRQDKTIAHSFIPARSRHSARIKSQAKHSATIRQDLADHETCRSRQRAPVDGSGSITAHLSRKRNFS